MALRIRGMEVPVARIEVEVWGCQPVGANAAIRGRKPERRPTTS